MFARVVSHRAYTPVARVNLRSLEHRALRFYSSIPDVPMPALSPTMETGTIVSWQKKVGDAITAGDVLAEVETDKAKIAFETTDEGYIAKFLVEEGTTGIPVGKPVIIVVEKKEDIAKFADYVPSEAAPAAATASTSIKQETPGPQPDVVLALPALSPTMETGKIVSWTKKEGDLIAPGDAIAEIETDKATITFESTDDGYIAKVMVEAGSSVKVGSPIAVVVSKRDDIPKFKNFSVADLDTAGGSASSGSDQASSAPASPTVTVKASGVTQQGSSSDSRVFASPKARAAAKEKGIILSEVRGTGPNGRVIFADIEEFVPSKVEEVAESSKAKPAAIPTIAGAFTDLPASNIRKIIAERLLASKQNIPHYYLTVECNAENLQSLRQKLNDLSKGEFKLSVNDFVIKAAAIALKAVPEVNSEWRETYVRRYHNVDINVAVNTDKGLLTPIIRDCDKIGLASISNSVKDVAGRAQEGVSTLDDLQVTSYEDATYAQMGTFTISNLGMFGIKQFCAVINPPQAAILAVGGIDQKPVLVTPKDPEETPKFKTVSTLTVTLSCDHRVVDGAVGAKWLQVFKDAIENPLKFML